MSEQFQVRRSNRRLSLFHKVPWSVLVIAYMVVIHALQIDMAGVAGYIFAGLCVAVLLVEFLKSADISPWVFGLDLVGALAAVILATALMSYLILRTEQQPTFFDWLGCAVILGDAVLGPLNAFRTALRNIGVGLPG